MKRSCMKTQATQTDASLVMKSLPHIPISPASDKSMISQSAQTNGSSYRRRRLVKSLSEAARYEGPDYEIYDLDGDVPPPPPPPSKSINQVLPLYPKEHSFWNYPSYHSESFDQSRSEEESTSGSFGSEHAEQCRCCLDRNFEDELFMYSPTSSLKNKTKDFSDEDGKKSESGNSSMETNSTDIRKQDAIQHSPNCSLSKAVTHQDSQHEKMKDWKTGNEKSQSPLVAMDVTQKSADEIEKSASDDSENQESTGPFKKKVSSSSAINDLIGINFNETPDNTVVNQWSSPDQLSSQECLDNIDESISDSQITVLQKLQPHSSNGIHQISDSETSNNIQESFHINSKSLDKICKTANENLSNEIINNQNDANRELNSKDELVTESSELMSSSKHSKVGSSKSSSPKSISSDGKKEETILKTEEITSKSQNTSISSQTLESQAGKDSKVVQTDKEESQVNVKNSSRKLHSPESDSSMSHLTEKESSRSSRSSSSIQGSNLKSECSRRESREATTDQSITSEDYVTANESATLTSDTKRLKNDKNKTNFSSAKSKFHESPNSTLKSANKNASVRTNEDASSYGLDHASDFETAHDLTSPEGDTTTSASYQIEIDDKNSSLHQLDNISNLSFSTSPCRKLESTKTGGLQNLRETNYDVKNESNKPKESDYGTLNVKRDKFYFSEKQQKYVMASNRTNREQLNYGNNSTNNDESTGYRRHSVQEVRDKKKSEMKLNFPQGVTMFSSSSMTENDTWQRATPTNEPQNANQYSVSEYTQTTPSEALDKRSFKGKCSESNRRADSVKRETEEVCTPGMVRSPAMHEGFRLEDWTLIRTPGTPDVSLNDNEDSKEFQNNNKSNDMKVSKNIETNNKKDPRNTRKLSQDITDDQPPFSCHRGNQKSHVKGFKNSFTSLQGDNTLTNYNTMPRVFQDSALKEPEPKYSLQTSHSGRMPSNKYYNDARRQSGDFGLGFSLRQNETLQTNNSRFLGTCDYLRKTESLRSFSSTSDNVFLGSSAEHLDGCKFHLCTKCGNQPLPEDRMHKSLYSSSYSKPLERSIADSELKKTRTLLHRGKSEERSSLMRDLGVTGLSLELGDHPIRSREDDNDTGQYIEPYSAYQWLYVSPNDELLAWKKDAMPPPFIPPYVRISGYSYPEVPSVTHNLNESGGKENDNFTSLRSDSPDSTCSEKQFRTRYQAITHRLIHRKASLEMYRKIICGNFRTDKTLSVARDSRGEFGFRIHGSRPVVVSAIESATPAEESGLEIGDIIISINDISILEASHSDVVRLAHSGNEALRLTTARTCDVLMPMVTTDPTPICAGYLYKLGGSQHGRTSVNSSRKWHRRWFALKKDHCLYYYKSEVDQSPLGALRLGDYSVHALNDCVRPCSFTVAKFGGLTWHLSARTEEARNRWGQMITQAALEASQRDELLADIKKRLQQSPGAIATPDCFGHLYKLNTRWYQWKRVYCVLKDACLFLYTDTDATAAMGAVCLHGYHVQGTSIGGRKYAFELLPPDPKFRHFYFHTDSENDKKRWLAGLEYSIERWIKVE